MSNTQIALPSERAAEQREAGATLRDKIRAMESQFALAMPKGIEAAQLVRDALTCLQQTPKLADCVPQTVLGSLMTCAQLGLRPGVSGLGHAWVLPYWDKNYDLGGGRRGAYVAQLIIGYKGYVDLAYRSGQIATVIGRTVYEGDTFDVEYGLDDKLVHKPAVSGERSKPVGHYCIVKLANGGRSFWYMTEDEMQAWKRRYAPKNRKGDIVGPWISDYEAMARKTCLLRLAAWMPKSTDLALAIEVDNGVRASLMPEAATVPAIQAPTPVDSGDSKLPAAVSPDPQAPHPAAGSTSGGEDSAGASSLPPADGLAPSPPEPPEGVDVTTGEIVEEPSEANQSSVSGEGAAVTPESAAASSPPATPPGRPAAAGKIRLLRAHMDRLRLAPGEHFWVLDAITGRTLDQGADWPAQISGGEADRANQLLGACETREDLWARLEQTDTTREDS